VRCGRCGNENDGANRFCGMCGASLVAATAPAGRAQAAGAPTESGAAHKVVSVPAPPVPVQPTPAQKQESTIPEPARFRQANIEPRSAPLRTETRANEIRTNVVRTHDVRPSAGPVISGHSFLGLSTPGPAIDRSAEPDTLRPSSSVDYLLDDEEEPKRGWGKLVFIVVALALAVGLGYLHFKEAGFDGLTAGDKKPVATKPTADAPQNPDSGAVAGPATPNSAAPPAGVSNNGTAPAAGSDAATPAQPGAQAPAQSAPSQTAPATSQPVPVSQTPPTASAPAQSVPSQTPPVDPNLPAGAAPAPSGSDQQTTATAEASPTPKPAIPAPAIAKPPAAKPIDPVSNAERYIYGRGVREDCDHGLRLLKEAADESNAKAMISMGALYSTGTCTPRDLPTAYRWFALALHKEPDNQALQDDLQKLWSQMTQPERQLAIKLSQ
jgi:hypothetical protein